MSTPTDLAAAAERLAGIGTAPFVHGYDLRAQLADAQIVAREYLRLLPYIRAVRDRRAEWDAAEPGANGCAGFAYAETLDRLADAVCNN